MRFSKAMKLTDVKGLKAGDIIIKVGNQSLENMDKDQLSHNVKRGAKHLFRHLYS